MCRAERRKEISYAFIFKITLTTVNGFGIMTEAERRDTMTIETLGQLGILFIGSAISNTTGTLKNNFTVKGYIKPMYITTFLDAMIFALVTKGMISGSGFLHTFVYACGRVLGSYIARKMENKIALGVMEVDVLFNNKDKATEIADELRDMGYSVEGMVENGFKGKKRRLLRVTINRKDVDILKETLAKHGYKKPTMKMKELDDVAGNFAT